MKEIQKMRKKVVEPPFEIYEEDYDFAKYLLWELKLLNMEDFDLPPEVVDFIKILHFKGIHDVQARNDFRDEVVKKIANRFDKEKEYNLEFTIKDRNGEKRPFNMKNMVFTAATVVIHQLPEKGQKKTDVKDKDVAIYEFYQRCLIIRETQKLSKKKLTDYKLTVLAAYFAHALGFDKTIDENTNCPTLFRKGNYATHKKKKSKS